MEEKEIKFLNIDSDLIEKKLKEIGAKEFLKYFTREEFLIIRI